MDLVHVLFLVWLAGTLSYWSAIVEEERRQVVRVHPLALFIHSMYWPFHLIFEIFMMIFGRD